MPYASPETVRDLKNYLDPVLKQDHATNGLVDRFLIGQLGGEIPAMIVVLYISDQATDEELEVIAACVPPVFENHPLTVLCTRDSSIKQKTP